MQSSPFPLPPAVLEALAGGLSSAAVGLAIKAGYSDATQLTNIVFYFRHPEMIGRKIQPEERDLAREWLAIRDRLVTPALASAVAARRRRHPRLLPGSRRRRRRCYRRTACSGPAIRTKSSTS